MRRGVLAVVAAAGLLVGVGAFTGVAKAQGSSAAAKGEDASKLLEKARAALSKVNALSYEGSVVGGGGLNAPEVKAQVSMAKADAGGWKVYAKGTSGTTPFEVAYDGVQAKSVREADKAVYEKTPKDHADLIVLFSGQQAKHPVAWELIEESPLPATGTPVLEGEATVDGEACDVVRVPGKADAKEGAPDADYGYSVAIARRDSLPRRIERRVGIAGTQSRVLTLSKFKVNGESVGAPYSLSVPDGYAVRQADVVKKKKGPSGGPKEPKQAKPAGKVDVGAVAPEFALKDASGKEHKLSDYKGRVVVLDFWATWCGPCKMAMPGLQKLHTKYKGRGVSVLGINVNENGDPVEYMKKNKFTYGLLLNGEELAQSYEIGPIPMFIIVGKDGKIIWKAVGYSPDHQQEMAEVIEKELGSKGEGEKKGGE